MEGMRRARYGIVGSGTSISSLGALPSQNLHVLTNLEAFHLEVLHETFITKAWLTKSSALGYWTPPPGPLPSAEVRLEYSWRLGVGDSLIMTWLVLLVTSPYHKPLQDPLQESPH